MTETTPRAPVLVALVHNRFTHDARVLNEARSAASMGFRVIVAAVADRELPDRESRDAITVVRFGFDPPDTRVWRNRSRVSRPWRFRRQLASWVRRRISGGPRDRLSAILGLLAAVALLPWVGLTIAYHYGIRVFDRPLRSLGWPAPSVVIGGWIEERARRLVFAAHRPLRLRDWGRRIESAIDDRSIPPAEIWHAHDLETVPLALGLSRRFGGKVIFDSHELFLEAAGRARTGRARRALLRTAESRWIHRVDAVVTVNSAIAAELVRRYHIPRPIVVRNCPPLWTPLPTGASPLHHALRNGGFDPNRAIVIAHGGFQAERGFEQLLAAAEPLAGVTVVFLGYGPLEAQYRAVAASAPWLGRLAVLPAVPPDDLLVWLAGADIAACLIQPTTLNHRLSTPNKLFEAIAAGLPLLAADLPAIAQIVRSMGLGRLVDPTDPAAIRSGLVELVDAPASEKAAVRENARRAAEAELNWEHEFVALAVLYRQLAPVDRPAQAASRPLHPEPIGDAARGG